MQLIIFFLLCQLHLIYIWFERKVVEKREKQNKAHTNMSQRIKKMRLKKKAKNGVLYGNYMRQQRLLLR